MAVSTSITDAFVAFCPVGRTEMNGRSFAKLCKDCQLLTSSFSAADADLLFIGLADGQRRINFTQFEEALQLVAKRMGVETEAVRHSVGQVGRPLFHSTQAPPVRLHDVKQNMSSYCAGRGMKSPIREKRLSLSVWEEMTLTEQNSPTPPRIRRVVSPSSREREPLSSPRVRTQCTVPPAMEKGRLQETPQHSSSPSRGGPCASPAMEKAKAVSPSSRESSCATATPSPDKTVRTSQVRSIADAIADARNEFHDTCKIHAPDELDEARAVDDITAMQEALQREIALARANEIAKARAFEQARAVEEFRAIEASVGSSEFPSSSFGGLSPRGHLEARADFVSDALAAVEAVTKPYRTNLAFLAASGHPMLQGLPETAATETEPQGIAGPMVHGLADLAAAAAMQAYAQPTLEAVEANGADQANGHPILQGLEEIAAPNASSPSSLRHVAPEKQGSDEAIQEPPAPVTSVNLDASGRFDSVALAAESQAQPPCVEQQQQVSSPLAIKVEDTSLELHKVIFPIAIQEKVEADDPQNVSLVTTPLALIYEDDEAGADLHITGQPLEEEPVDVEPDVADTGGMLGEVLPDDFWEGLPDPVLNTPSRHALTATTLTGADEDVESPSERWKCRRRLGQSQSGALDLSCANLSVSNLNIAICNGRGDTPPRDSPTQADPLSTTIGSNATACSSSSTAVALIRLQVEREPEVAVVVPGQTTVGELAVEFGQGLGPWHVHLLGVRSGRRVLMSQQVTIGSIVGVFRGPGAVPSFAIRTRPIDQEGLALEDGLVKQDCAPPRPVSAGSGWKDYLASCSASLCMYTFGLRVFHKRIEPALNHKEPVEAAARKTAAVGLDENTDPMSVKCLASGANH